MNRHNAPVRTRAAIENERDAVEDAVADVVGREDASRLIALGDEIRDVEVRRREPETAMQRVLALMDTAEGRKTLARHTWSTL